MEMDNSLSDNDGSYEALDMSYEDMQESFEDDANDSGSLSEASYNSQLLDSSEGQIESFMEPKMEHSELLLPVTEEMKEEVKKEPVAKSKKEQDEEEREKMQVLVSHFTEDQLDRYEMYRRSAFPKAAIKRVMQTITGCSVSHNVVIAMAGIAKVFVGEVVEGGLNVMEEMGESGPLQPKHLRESTRRIRYNNGHYLPSLKQKRLF